MHQLLRLSLVGWPTSVRQSEYDVPCESRDGNRADRPPPPWCRSGRRERRWCLTRAIRMRKTTSRHVALRRLFSTVPQGGAGLEEEGGVPPTPQGKGWAASGVLSCEHEGGGTNRETHKTEQLDGQGAHAAGGGKLVAWLVGNTNGRGIRALLDAHARDAAGAAGDLPL